MKKLKDKIRFNLYHDWNGIFAWCDYEHCPTCGCPNKRELIDKIVDEIYRSLPWYKKLFKK